MGCGCGNNTPNNNPAQQSQCKPRCNSCPSSVQPEMVRMTRNVNASCTPSCSKTPKCCTRKEWLSGIDCSGMGFNLDNAELGVEQGAIARLRAVYKNSAGSYVDPVEPRITIKGPCGKVFLSNQGLTRQDIGRYFFLFGTDGNTDYGLWSAEVTGVVLENGNNIRVTGQYYFAVLPCGSIPFNNCNDGYGPDGYGDGYGCDGYGDGYGHCGKDHCGHGIYSGADGYGTFAGREECGFDGCRSKDIPATGGCRTNRNGVGDGFWDGISYESSCITPIGKRGMCMKDRAVAMTRVRLKDIDAKCWAFSEDEVDLQLETSLSDFNAWPAFTCFTWDTLPENFLGVITLGAQVFSLFSQGLLEAGREFNITDNGISFQNPPISGYMQTTASTLLQSYTEMKEKIKANIKPSPAGIGTFRVMSILPTLSRLRHLRAKQII